MSEQEDLRVVAIADADSFVKWAAALLDSVTGARRQLLVVRTPLTVSAAQERAARAGTALADDPADRLDFDELRDRLQRECADVVVLAGRGPFVRLVMRVVDQLTPRPVTVSGLPGMSIPAQRGALEYRRECDLLVLHSRREQRAFAALGERLGVTVPSALATLPYARVPAGVGAGAGAGVPGSSGGIAERCDDGDLVFAAQALVPAHRQERAVIVDTLRRAASANPRRRVVVKLRSRPGEAETHRERDAYAGMLAARPDNLVISYEPMSQALRGAAGLVTVSSTAAIEAIAQGVPVIALDTFGVSKPLLNTVFLASGLLGGARDVIAGRFQWPDEGWMRDNYFHPPEESDWWERVEQLVRLRRAGVLPARPVPTGRGGALRAAWHRKSVLGTHDPSLMGHVALGLGTPLVRATLALRRVQGRATDDTWADPATDYTIAPTPHRDPIRR